MRRVALATAILGAAALTLHAQSNIVFSGRVVADATGDPIPNARIVIPGAPIGSPTTLTGAEGRFEIAVPAGTASLQGVKTGYAPATARATADRPVEFRLRRGGVLTGRLVDQLGEPVPSVLIRAEHVPGSGATSDATAASTTDDLGEFRIWGLPEGEYVVSAGPQGLAIGATAAARAIYFPGVYSPAEARVIRIVEGAELSGIDFTVPVEELTLPPGVQSRRQEHPGSRLDGNGVVQGTVRTQHGAPVVYATVMLAAGDVVNTLVTRSDQRGDFAFSGVPNGAFRLAARKRAYGVSTLKTGDGTLQITDTSPTATVDIILEVGRVISGRVIDELGDPIQNARVQTLQVHYERGRRRLVQVGVNGVTNDLGEYRLWGKFPGHYIVSAGGGGPTVPALPGYARSFYPGTAIPARARFVVLDGEHDATGIDFDLTRAATFRVAGELLSPLGGPTMGGTLTLLPSAGSGSVVGVPLGARIEENGQFEFSGVAPGDYIVRAELGRGHPATEGALATLKVVVVDHDVTGLHLQMSSGSRISGRVTFETFDGSAQPSTSDVEVIPEPVDFDLAPMGLASARADHPGNSFEMSGINGPRRLRVQGLPPGWALKEIRVNGIDVTDQPLPFGREEQSLTNVEVILTDRITRVSGRVGDPNGRPMTGATVIVFSTDRSQWYSGSRFVQRTTAGTNQSYAIDGLPPGSYFGAVVRRPPQDGEDAWRDPEYLESLVLGATSVNLGAGDSMAVNLRAR